MKYSEKLKDPRWQKKRLEVLERDDFKCLICSDKKSTLHVHHVEYTEGEPWEINSDSLLTLCESCHDTESEELKSGWIKLQKSLKSKGFTSFHVFALSVFLDRSNIRLSPCDLLDKAKRTIENSDEMQKSIDAFLSYFKITNNQP